VNNNGDGWWKSDPNTCRMENGDYTFEPDCHKRVMDKLSQFPACATFDPSLIQGIGFGSDAIALVEFGISDGRVTPVGKKIIRGTAPNGFLERGDFAVQTNSSKGRLLVRKALEDPRVSTYLDAESKPGNGSNESQTERDSGVLLYGDPAIRGHGKVVRDDINFTVAMPFDEGLRSLDLLNASTNETLVAVDLGQEILDYCKAQGYTDPQCKNSDLDNDGVPDRQDGNPLERGGPILPETTAGGAEGGGASQDWVIYALIGVVAVLVALMALKLRKKPV
jgi:hypothetical protein